MSHSTTMITERSGVTVGRHLPPFAGVGMPSRSGATHVITERSGVTVGRHLLPFAGVGMPSRSGATHVITERSGVTVGRHLLPFAGVGMPSRSGATHVIARAVWLGALVALAGCSVVSRQHLDDLQGGSDAGPGRDGEVVD